MTKVDGEKKRKKAKTEQAEEPAASPAKSASEQPRVQVLAPIAKPLAEEKLRKKVLKLAKKATKRKLTKRGVKEVVKSLRKQPNGVCVIAGDISPIDVITHIPVFCEDRDVPYIFVPSKEELGAAGLTKRPTSCMLLLPLATKAADDEAKEYSESYEDVKKLVKDLQPIY
ncbi:hypothetical protein WJX73_006364 [Symbiochloris irregularis]|uniref:H/ACA ribonucleoprotein complex subunit 2 n=1 Tax=Symbiochloris irregularis TaxID=706552 RepID=A0AAW1PHS5_9CHLO